ncbi:nucleoside-diphosphate-sugar epimerase [Algoriphagus aquaeductus]|uniref:Nucleoside-diphosphate-sugar epimerase n=1 Tax=Algoriphagus aquaeductus TaxID=475299 RepID=A0A326RPC3_9BACT|nr:NAD-dependent epimerase/dehydratase family protein [Algoriphagus aquaeductus]PZV79133.1 nucleoside-diphosphate-sugar epimerase [Algoriphagus aquaeductus]
MKTLLTGGTGFLGFYLLKHLKGEVITLGRSNRNTISCDLEKQIPDLPEVDLVIHNAGLAHRVPKNQKEEQSFFQTNLIGTKNLLSAMDKMITKPKSFVFISTVAVYGLEKGEMINENMKPSPNTAYGKSKLEAEYLLQNWASVNNMNLVILRLPLVAGANNPPGNLGAMIKAIRKGYYRRIGEAKARKSMVLAEDVAQLIPTLRPYSGTYNLTDGQNPSVKELEEYLGDIYGRKIKRISQRLLRMATWIGNRVPGFPINSHRLAKLGDSLTFDDTKAKNEIGWRPKPVIGNLEISQINK